jgi:hypothetical protein
MLWIISAGLVVVWFVLKFPLHKGGYVHILLMGAASVFVVQLIAHRKTQYHKTSGHG